MFLSDFSIAKDFRRNFIAFFPPPAHFCFVVGPRRATMMLERDIILLCVLSIPKSATIVLILLRSSNIRAPNAFFAQQPSTVVFGQQTSPTGQSG